VAFLLLHVGLKKIGLVLFYKKTRFSK